MDALHEVGLFRLLLPQAFGGREVDPVTFARVIEEVARADASTAWCLCQASGCSMVSAYLDSEIGAEIFGSDPRAVLAWGQPSGARAVARALLHTTLTDAWAVASASEPGTLALEQRVRIRLATTFGIHQAVEVAETVYHAAGSSAIFANYPFERRFRDIHAVSQQVQGRQAHFETVGQFLLGLEPDQSFL